MKKEIKSKDFLTFLLIACSILLIASFSQTFSVHAEGEVNNTTTQQIEHLWVGHTELHTITYDQSNNIAYFGGFGNQFGAYNMTSNVTEDLSSTVGEGFASNPTLQGAAYDSNNNLVYLVASTGGSNRLGVYNRTANATYSLGTTDPGDWIGFASLYSVAYDSNNDLVYVGGSDGTFGVYDRTGVINGTANITHDLRATDEGDWIGTDPSSSFLLTLAYDPNNDLVYLGGSYQIFGVYNRTANITYDLRGTDINDWIGSDAPYYSLRGLSYDSDNDLVYFGGSNSRFGVYDRTGVINGTANLTYDLRGTDTGNWIGTNPAIYQTTYDSDNDLVYLVGGSGNEAGTLGVYDRTGVINGTANLTYDLRGTDTGNWIGRNVINSVTYAANGLVFLVGKLGVYGFYNRTSNITTDLNTPNDFIRYTQIKSLDYDSNNDLVYIGGESGVFGYYNRTANTKTDLRETDLGDWMGSGVVYAVAYDFEDNLAYLVGQSGIKFGAYNKSADLLENLNTTGSFPNSQFNSIVFSSDNNLVYINSIIGQIGVYNRATNTTEFPFSFQIFASHSIVHDQNNNILYAAGTGGQFKSHDLLSNTTTSLNETDTDNWIGTRDINYITYDSNNSRVYIFGDSSVFGYYNISDNTTYDLRATDLNNWLGSSSELYSGDHCADDDTLYFTGSNGVFGVYNRTNNTVYDLRGTDTGNWVGTNALYAVTCDETNDLVYVGGLYGTFGYYNKTSNTTEVIETLASSASGTSTASSESGGNLITSASTSQTISIPRISGGGSSSTIITSPLIDIRNITIFPKEDIENASLTVEQNPPTQELVNFAIPFGTFYQAFSITAKAIENENLNNVTLEFRVNKTWLAEQNYSYDNVALYRVENETSPWQKLSTISINNNTDYYYFTAVSPGFSTFVVVASEKAFKCTPLQTRCFNNEVQMCDENSTWISTETCSEACQNGKCITGQKEKILFYSVVIFAASGVLIAGYLLFRKTQKKQKTKH